MRRRWLDIKSNYLHPTGGEKKLSCGDFESAIRFDFSNDDCVRLPLSMLWPDSSQTTWILWSFTLWNVIHSLVGEPILRVTLTLTDSIWVIDNHLRFMSMRSKIGYTKLLLRILLRQIQQVKKE